MVLAWAALGACSVDDRNPTTLADGGVLQPEPSERDVNDCREDTCQNGGECVDRVESFTCACQMGFSGLLCERRVQGCSDAPCQDGGTCSESEGEYRCACPPEFSGTHCEVDVDDCLDAGCTNESVCVDLVGGFDCQCKPGFDGDLCELDVNECTTSEPCASGTLCVNLPGSFRCDEIDEIDECAGVGECALAPAGWSGPVIFLTGTEESPPICPGSAPTASFQAFSGLNVGEPACDCSCESVPLAAQSCGNVQLGLRGAPCGVVPDLLQGVAIQNQCNPMTGTMQPGGPYCCWAVGPSVWIASEDCASQLAADIPPIVWEAAHVACALPTGCQTSGACAPTLEPGQELCVYADGDVECPAAFPDKLATSGGANDTRACSACTCGEPAGSCSGEIRIRDGGCGGGFPSELVRLDINACHIPSDALFGVESIAVDGFFAPSGGACAASTSEPEGSVTTTEARTVCCR